MIGLFVNLVPLVTAVGTTVGGILGSIGTTIGGTAVTVGLTLGATIGL